MLTALNADGFDTGRIRVDGGMVANSWFLQFLADVTATTIDRPDMIESTARGAAFLSGLQSGVFDSVDALESLWQSETVFRPTMDAAEREMLVSSTANRMVGAAGFEPTTPCPPDKCATGLRYAPTRRLLNRGAYVMQSLLLQLSQAAFRRRAASRRALMSMRSLSMVSSRSAPLRPVF